MIREAQESDLEEVFNLIYSAFGDKSESNLVRQLILDDDLLFNLIFENSDTIIGNVVVSKITMEPNEGLLCGGVAPLSVLPENQSSGIGSQLMEAAIKKSKEMNINALFLLGDPNYYKRFGFTISDLQSDYNAEHFQELAITKECLVNVKSKVIYANAFKSL
jgi:putative acetyltransferase